MVCIPMGRDQDDPAARVTHHGAGIRLSRSSSTSAIRDAATQVLAREDYRRAARGLATAIHAEREPTELISEVESLRRTDEETH